MGAIDTAFKVNEACGKQAGPENRQLRAIISRYRAAMDGYKAGRETQWSYAALPRMWTVQGR
jgi:hypothetical protein